MIKKKNIFLGKKILIYGLGKSGFSSYKFLNNKAEVYLFDDDIKKILNLNQVKELIVLKKYQKLTLIKLLLVQELIF